MTIFSILFVLFVTAVFVFAAPKKCSNGLDDDNDGLIDYPNDPGCSNKNDNSETSSSLVCDNGADETNDADTLADYRLSNGDPGCVNVTDTSEIDGQCDDLVDNSDRDTAIDYPNDTGCVSYNDQSEVNGICDDSVDDASDADTLADGVDPGCSSFSDTTEIDAQCDDLVDNDADNFTDYPSDIGCTGYSDNDETNIVQCNDGSDNDNDGLIDYPADAGCSSSSDTSETSSSLVCDNGADETNDADTLADYRLSNGDPGCVNVTDTSEIDGQCDDLSDNDGDTLTDYSTDTGCSSFSDSSELGTLQCDDGTDNDGDGKTDFGSLQTKDSKCSSSTDDDESPKDSCSDSDGGQVSSVQGTVSGDDESVPYSFTDFCISASNLTEYYCGTKSQDYAPLNIIMSCSGNTTCSNGACV